MAKTTVHAAAQSMPKRLEVAKARVRSARDHLAAELEIRDRLIIEATDEGLSLRAIGALVGASDSTVHKVLTNAGKYQEGQD